MADRSVVASNTFEQFRVEFNELATDVGDIASITGASGTIASATDVIEAVTAINSQLPSNITFTANEIDVASGDLTIDVAGDIILDAGANDIKFFNNGTYHFNIDQDSNDTILTQTVNNGDIKFVGQDDGTGIFALTLDMSDAGKAIFNKDIQLNNSGVISNGSVNLSFPTVGGAISTEGFSIALATALG